jgi:hypothetical protein
MMTAAELQALRRLLFFTQQEAASMISGTSHRAWQHWEDGKRAVPVDVVERIRELAEWRETAIDSMLAAIQDNIDAHDGIKPESIPLVWYAHMQDWLGEPVMWRPHQSACAALLALAKRVRLVPFDSAAYAAWLGNEADSSPHRAAWAATIPPPT